MPKIVDKTLAEQVVDEIQKLIQKVENEHYLFTSKKKKDLIC
ncbi:hypothetical protein [Piscirickettsia salmonis]|nr:hypothetical protein [Piscirickettsia salmonis]